ncbi:MAG: DUF4143 domain-containing protein [Propionibacteriaceae bacterium]|jgi:predicted AAA+ superfamily ATPase|nr:DUF4143 domain-containing protein [Propionibacteriaceae bacterium]
METPEYSRRLVDALLDELLPELSAVAVEGAKGVGKTATAARRATRRVRLDVEEEREAFAALPFDLVPRGTLLLDEWQRFPEAWDRVRRAVDDGAPAGSFILTGSSAPKGAAVHSGAGRIVPLRLRPLSLAERRIEQATVSLGDLLRQPPGPIEGETRIGLPEYVEEIFASGFPGIRPLGARARRARLDGYIDNTINREFAEQGINVRRPQTLLAWLRAYAAATATSASYTNILDASTAGVNQKPAQSTTLVYRDVLARAFLLDPLMAWIPTMNPLARLATTPRHFLVDPALSARLLSLDQETVLTGRDLQETPLSQGSMLGALFEALVVQSVRIYADVNDAEAGHLRQYDGRHEIDLIVNQGARFVGIEVKLARTVEDRDVRHLLWLKAQMGTLMADMIVVTTGTRAYRRPDGVAVIPAILLGP